MTIGTYIKQKRDANYLTLAELARRAGISKGYLSTLENGEVASPGLDVIDAISKVFGLRAGDLLVEAGYTIGERPAVRRALVEMVFEDNGMVNIVRAEVS